MTNKWFKLALVSFVGIIVSLVGLYFVQLFGRQSGPIGVNQMGTMQMPYSQTQGMNGMGQQQMQGGLQPQYPAPGFGFREFGPPWNNGYGPGNMNMMRQRIESSNGMPGM